MANIKSQKKRILTNAKAQARNKAVRSELKTRDQEGRRGRRRRRQGRRHRSRARGARKLDKAASKGVIHKNQAANRKSGVMKQVDGLEG